MVGSVIFAGMSGTAVADAGGLGNIEIKAMRDHGYDVDSPSASPAPRPRIGPIIPPSLPMVIYGVAGQRLDRHSSSLAGFIPGLLMAATLMVMVAFYAHKRNFGRDLPFRWGVFGFALVEIAAIVFTVVRGRLSG